MPESVLVLGANGQDGMFLCRHLRARGYDVVAIGRQATPRADVGQRYLHLDLRDEVGLAALLAQVKPDLVFHVAAVHHRAGLPYEGMFGDMLLVNVRSVHTVLEYARTAAASTRLLYASSAKVFGTPLPAHVDETTPRRNDCLYSITKNAATDLIHYYRHEHDIAASVLYLFNHESELRPADFFVPKLVSALARALAREAGGPVDVETLDFYCDWGSAEEYMAMAIDLLVEHPGEDVVVATGRTELARALAARLFATYGLRADDWLRERLPRSDPSGYFQVKIDKLARLLGRRPRQSIDAVCVQALATAGAAAGRAGEMAADQWPASSSPTRGA